MTAIEMIRLVGAEFKDVDDATVEKWIEMVRPMVSKKQFCKFYEQALAYLVCHKLKMAGYGESPFEDLGLNSAVGIGLTVGSVSEGGSSISFGANAASMLVKDAELGLTVYGAQFLTIRRIAIVPIRCGGEVD